MKSVFAQKHQPTPQLPLHPCTNIQLFTSQNHVISIYMYCITSVKLCLFTNAALAHNENGLLAHTIVQYIRQIDDIALITVQCHVM